LGFREFNQDNQSPQAVVEAPCAANETWNLQVGNGSAAIGTSSGRSSVMKTFPDVGNFVTRRYSCASGPISPDWSRRRTRLLVLSSSWRPDMPNCKLCLC